MATVPGSRPGAGGKIVTNRRGQRLAATPYDRPPLPHPPPPKSPNWFTGVIIPSARSLASGAGKFLSSAIFSDSESSSSEDLDSASEDDVNNINEHESSCDQVNALNEQKLTSSEMLLHGRESQFNVQRTETKRLIEQLIMQESFSREECDRLIKVLNSRVMGWSKEAVENRSLANSPAQVDYEDVDVFNKAVLEAKKWFQEKKVGSSSVAELAHGTCNLNSTAFDHIESVVGSPVDMARSYMRDRPPWASPTEHVELRTPLTTTMELFKEGSPFSVSHDILSSSKRRSSLASGPCNIQEELRKVRSKAIDDMLHPPPAKIDSSFFPVAPTREESAGAGKVVSGVEERISEQHSFLKTKPIDALMDVGVGSDPALVALESRQDGKASEAPSLNPDASVSGNNEKLFRLMVNVPTKFPLSISRNHAGEQNSDPHSSKISGPPGTEAAEFGGRPYANGISSTQASLSPGEAVVQNCKRYGEESHNVRTVSENRPTNTVNVEGNCGLLSEAYMEVPIIAETHSFASDSQISLNVQYEESPLGMTQPSTEAKPDITTGRQQGRKLGKNSRRGRGRGK